MRIYLLCALLLMLCSGAEAKKKHSSSSSTSPISPSRESLIRQNLCLDQMGIVRIQSEQELDEMVAQGLLSPIPITKALRVSPSLPQERRYVSSFVTPFLLSLSEQFYSKFGKPLVIDSAVRPRDVQERLRHTNYAAAPADGETASSHESGLTVDFSKRMTGAQLRWMRSMLIMYQATNVVIAEEERRCFHVEVIGGTE